MSAGRMFAPSRSLAVQLSGSLLFPFKRVLMIVFAYATHPPHGGTPPWPNVPQTECAAQGGTPARFLGVLPALKTGDMESGATDTECGRSSPVGEPKPYAESSTTRSAGEIAT